MIPESAMRPYRRAPLLGAVLGLAMSVSAQPAEVLALAGADAATEAVFVRGLTAQWLGDHEDAITLFTRVLERRPDEPAVLAAMARSDAALGRTAEALASMSRAAERAPRDRDIQWEAATLQRELGRPDEALATLERLLRSAPDDRDALSALAEIHEDAGRPSAALPVLERMLVTLGEREDIRLRLHTQLDRMGDDARALATLEAGAAALPRARTLRLRLARAYLDAGRDAEGSRLLDELLRRDPSDREARALMDERAGAAPTATDELDAATRLRRAAAMMASIDEEPDAAGRVRELLEPIVSEPGPSPDALRMMGLLEHRMGSHSRAAELLATALRGDPRHPQAWEALVTAARLAGDAPGAAAAADEAVLLFPGRPLLLEASAAAYASVGRTNDARRALDEALALDEADGVTDALRARLEDARRSLD
jgi:tetratricopeptide (TPR) repeat protein